MITVAPSTSFETSIDWGVTGLTGTLRVSLLDGDGGTTTAPTTAGISEFPANSGRYEVNLTSPTLAGQYQVFWDDGSVTVGHTAPGDDILVTHAALGSSASAGCGLWITAEDVAATCEALESSGDPSVYDNAAQAASDVLFILSGRQFLGECGPITVRPCTGPCGCWPPGRVDIGWNQRLCGWLSQVKLSGYPVREVSEVKIDGEVLDASEYRLDARRFLTRLADTDGRAQRWPACQRLDLADTEEHTFAVTYTYGQDPPILGVEAAQQLACQIAAAGPDGTGECALPDGTISVTRQGVTIDIDRFVEEGISSLPLVGLFLQTYNPARLTKRSTVWTPDMAPYARRVG